MLGRAHMRTPLFCALLVLAAACRTESASEFETKQITANITAKATGSGSTDVSATFRKGSALLTFLQLTSDDEVKVTSGSQSAELKEFSLLGVVTYSASLPIDAQGTSFTVSLARKKDSGAPSSVATLPEAFTVDPLTGSFSRAAAGPTIRWSNAGSDPMKLSISGSCIDELDADLSSGATEYAVAAGAIKKRMQTGADGGTQIPDNCSVNAVVRRERAGMLDTGFAGGTAVGVQERSVSFTTTP
jgi:hypothetical protein